MWRAGAVGERHGVTGLVAVLGTALVAVLGTGLLGAALSAPPGSARFYRKTLAVSVTWVAGGLASGPVPLGPVPRRPREWGRAVAGPVLLGAGAFAGCYVAARVVRHIPLGHAALANVLRFADAGHTPLVVLSTLATGAGEEVFFRGAVYAAAGARRPVAVTTGVYALSTLATRNPTLVLASIGMGALFGWQRRVSGGVLAPMLTHVTWSALMLRFLPPLFRRR